MVYLQEMLKTGENWKVENSYWDPSSSHSPGSGTFIIQVTCDGIGACTNICYQVGSWVICGRPSVLIIIDNKIIIDMIFITTIN